MRINPGSTDVSVYFYIVQDASATSPGEPVTGLLFSDIETGGSASYARQGAARVDLTLITLASASAAHADGGFILVDDTNMPGLYRCDYPDAAFASGVDQVMLQIVVASANNAVASPIFVDIGTPGVNVTEWLGTAAATPTVAGVPEVDLTHMGGVAQSAADLKDFADAGYDPATNKVEGVKTVDVNTDTAATLGTPTDFGSGASTIAANLQDMADDGSEVYSRATDSLQAIRDRGDAAWTTGAGGSDPFVLQNTTIATLATQVSFTLTAGSADDGAYVGMLVVVEDQTTAVQKATGVILAYTGASKTITLREDPGVFTMAVGDTIDVVVVSPDILDILDDTGTTGVELTANAVDDIMDEPLTAGTHNVNNSLGKIIRQLQQNGTYLGGTVYLDTVGGTSGSEDWENGTDHKHVLTLAQANTVAISLGLSLFEVLTGSTVDFISAQTGQIWTGTGWTLGLGGNDVNNSFFVGATVAGVATAATEMQFADCIFGTASIQKARICESSFTGTVTMTLAGDYRYINCQSGIAGAAGPTFTKTAGQAITAEWRRWADSLNLTGLEAGDTVTINGTLGTITLAGSGGTVEIRGSYKALSIGGFSGTVNLEGAWKGDNIADTLEDTAEIGTAGAGLTDLGGMSTGMKTEVEDVVWDAELTPSSHNNVNSAGKKLRQIPATIIREDTAQGSGTGNNQIQLDAAASAVDGTFDPSALFISSGTGAGQTRMIIQYNGTTKTATVDRDWKVNPDATSVFVIIGFPGREHVNEGLAQAGGASTITLNTLASSLDDAYNGQIVFIRSGTGQDQTGTVIDYNGTTKVATVDLPWGVVPDTTSGYVMLPASPVELTGNTITAITADVDANSTELAAIKAKTDDLTYTKANELDINIQSVNDVTVNGTGALGDEWGP